MALLFKKLPMAGMGVFYPFRAKGIISKDLKFAGYVHHYKILRGNIFGLMLKNKMAAKGIFVMHEAV